MRRDAGGSSGRYEVSVNSEGVGWLWKQGAAQIPLAMVIEQGQMGPHERVAWCVNGSGVNSLLLAVDWRRSLGPLAPAAMSAVIVRM